jgi:regulator of protease activity HflC (stomatin/prohibitin superfamily)
VLDNFNIVNFAYSPEYSAAIEAKVTAQQNALTEQNKLVAVQFQAQQRVAQAQGEADAIKIQTAAINSQGGAAYVQLQAITKWNGALPIVMSGNAMPFINMNAITAGAIGSGVASGNIPITTSVMNYSTNVSG